MKKLLGYLIVLLGIILAVPVNAQFTATLTWVDNSTDEMGFTIQRQLNKGAWEVVGVGVGANITSYVDSTLVQDKIPNEYCFRLMAWNTSDGTPTGTVQNSAYSNVACKTIPAVITPPPAPTSLTISFLKGSGELKIGKYKLKFNKQDGNIEITNASSLTVNVP